MSLLFRRLQARLSVQSPWRYRAVGYVAMLASVAFPRFVPLYLLAGAVAFLLFRAMRAPPGHAAERVRAAWAKSRPVTAAAVCFAAWVLVASTWSANPTGGLGMSLLLALLIVFCLVVGNSVELGADTVGAWVAQGAIFGLLTAATYLAFEAVSGRAIGAFVYTQFPALQVGFDKHLRLRDGALAVSAANANRSTTVFALALWPAMLVAGRVLSGRVRSGVWIVLPVLMLVLLIYTDHQSSQLALLVSAAVLVAALVARTAVRLLLMCGWVAAVGLVVPFSIAAYQADLHRAPWLFNTARARIIIWEYTAQRYLEHPILGVGTHATRVIDRERTDARERPPGYASARETRAHPHNAYLQIWYELGAVGAVMFGAVGLAILSAAGRLGSYAEPFVLAQFATFAAIILSSYGMWQGWFMTSIALSTAALTLAIRLPKA